MPPPPIAPEPAGSELEPVPSPPETVGPTAEEKAKIVKKPEPEPSVEIADDLALILSSQLGWPVSFVSLVEAVETVWPDAYLDAPAEGEICVEDLTSGFAVTLEADGQCCS